MDYVIDTNYLRKQELADALQASSSDRYILTDTAVLETMKNERWESTAKASFKIIAQHPQKIWVAKAPGELLLNELSTGQETTDIFDAYQCDQFRLLLGEIASGRDGPHMEYLRAHIGEAQEKIAEQQQNHAENIKGLKYAYEDIKGTIDIAAYRRISDPSAKTQARLQHIKTHAQASLQRLVKLEGQTSDLGRVLAGGRGIILRYQIGYFCLGFKWAVNNGLDSFPAEKATNEVMDLSHALIATYFDDILTGETSVSQLRRDILQALDLNMSSAPLSPLTV
jgi:hypothetical protein